MNKKNTVFLAILMLLSPIMTWAVSTTQQEKLENIRKPLYVAYKNNPNDDFRWVPANNLNLYINALNEHLGSLNEQKKQLPGFFKQSAYTLLGGLTGLGSLTLGALSLLGIYDLTSKVTDLSLIIKYPEAFNFVSNHTIITTSDIPNLITQKEKLSGILSDFNFLSATFLVTGIGLFKLVDWYHNSINNKNNKINYEIKRDQNIIKKLQLIQTTINEPRYHH